MFLKRVWRSLDMLGWVGLGSTITMVVAFAVTTYYYRGRARRAERDNSRHGDKYLYQGRSHNNSTDNGKCHENVSLVEMIV